MVIIEDLEVMDISIIYNFIREITSSKGNRRDTVYYRHAQCCTKT